MTDRKQKNTDLLNALKELKRIAAKAKDSRVYAKVTHVSSSGMSRDITFKVITKKGDVYHIDGLIQKITGYRWARGWCDGVHVGGCGMDMIFNTLYVVNCIAMRHGIIKTSKNKTDHDLRYNGIVNTNYWSL